MNRRATHWGANLGPFFLDLRSPRCRGALREGRPLFRAFGWRLFVGVL